ncbi:T9SS type B sorting domain-containing protein [Chitinophaga tropicalis]|uniref:T9SS type B sorting domain-containing protein n=1 Tax=Chitinophaga tropicalis TaxID=2683588 RepID=A0A7K1U1Z3_9BACT|nr:gliding motility-associated C-terminal domain-containing protein [Chitinophaga tropicalis]MVT08392.1 T9SS type B sorting domain-containing protein [Chitinophaga tropicalis]
MRRINPFSTIIRNFNIFRLLLLLLFACALQAGKVMAQSPSITSVKKPLTAIYKEGDVLTFTVNFSESVIVNTGGGVPYLELLIGAQTKRAVYSGGSGSSSLTFVYTVVNNDLDADGVSLGAILELNGGTIQDVDGNNADVVPVNMDSNIVYVDAVPPSVVAVNVPAPRYYKAGEILSFQVVFSENVISSVVSGRAYIEVTIGSSVVRATLFSQTGNSLTFRYTVASADRDVDGITPGNTIVLNGTTIVDIAGNAVQPGLQNVGSTSGVLILDRPATNISGAIKLNAPWTASITFGDPVTGFDITDITGSNATYSNLQTSDNITYTVLVKPISDGGVSVEVPADVAFNAAGLGNTQVRLSYYYDATPPAITSIDVPANGAYKTGDVLNFTVHFSEEVRLFRTPVRATLPLIIGSTPVEAAYTGGQGTSVFTFAYTVQSGEMDLDGIAVGSAILMNGDRFTDVTSNDLITTVNNVGSTSNVFVNTATPGVSLSTTAPAVVNSPFTVILTFTEAVTGLNVAEISAGSATVSNLQTSDNLTYTALITPTTDGPVNVSLPAGVAVNSASTGNTASNTISVNYDGTPPQIAGGQHFSILQVSAAGTNVGTVSATPAPLLNWTIATDGAGGAFVIDASGVIKVQNSTILNTLAGTTVTLGVTVSDGLNTSGIVPVTIDVQLVNQAPTLDPVQDVVLCANTATHTIQLTGASATEPGQTYTITAVADQPFFDALSVNSSAVLSYELKPNVISGSTTVTVTIQDNGGTASGGADVLRRTFTITVNSLPVISIGSDKGASITGGEVVHLTASAGVGNYTYSWADAAGIISGKQEPVLEVKPLVSTTYHVTVTSSEGCINTAAFPLEVSGTLGIEATNILTPNGDGINDKWVVKNLELYPDNEVKIYDRAGRMVYNRKNYSNDWDGRVNGNPLGEGTYYYFITIKGELKLKGFITIVLRRY